MKKFLLMSLLGLTTCLTAVGQGLKGGKYYRIVNQNPDKSITSEGERIGYAITEHLVSNALTADVQGDDTQYNQLWKWVGSKFQNAQTQRYIPTMRGGNQQEYTNETGATASFSKASKGYIITMGNQVHANGGNLIMGWNDVNNESNWWDFEEVAVDEAALKAAQDEYQRVQVEKASLMEVVNNATTIAPIVEGYFTDKACTTLKSEYAGMTDEAFKAKMAGDGLTEPVQNMVLGIKNKWKDEYNPALSAKFRVQSYKIATRCEDGYTDANPSPKTKWVATQMSDRNNPTGIWTDGLQLIYVFVESEIPEGATLGIAGASGSGEFNVYARDAVQLHQGMNIIYSGLDYTTQWIMYTCAADYSKPLSKYPEMKIHIEGGNVLGYVKVDTDSEEATNAEYETMLKNAVGLMRSKNKDLSKINFTVMAERGLFEFPVETYRQIWSDNVYDTSRGAYGYNIYKSIMFYDNVLKWEWSNMGWQDRVENGEADNDLENLAAGGGDAIWPTYVNCKAPTVQCGGDKNPHSGNSITAMPGIWGVESSYNAERADFDTWCCGHESGHNNQHTINLPSSMESSNNTFSNIITVQHGYRMSRGGTFDDNFNYSQQNLIFSHRDIGMTMRMYFNLWLYYHQAGKKKDFMPKLHNLLRADRMNFGGEGWHVGSFGGANKGSAANSWLKFYEKVCDAAQEDLTEYFRLWGFFIPTSEAGGAIEKIGDKYYAYCGDYSSFYIRCDQEDIDAAIARVKAKNYPENLQIMFMEDRQLLRQRHDPWAKEGDMKPDNGGGMRTAEQLKASYGELGDVLTFIDGSANTSSYSYILSGNRVTMTGNGGAGFIVRDKEGNIAYLSNRKEFDIPADLALAGFTIETINANGSKSEVIDKAKDPNATDEDKLLILQRALSLAADYTAMEDMTDKKVGLYSTEVITPLKNIVAEANGVVDGTQADKYLEMADKLSAEVLRLQKEDPSNKIKTNALYTINSVRSTDRFLAANGNAVTSTTDATANEAQWMFVPANDKNDGTYYLQNRSNARFLGAYYNDKNDVKGVTMASDMPTANSLVKVTAMGMGKFLVRPMDKTNINQDPHGSIAMWGAGDEGSQWTILEVEEVTAVTDELFAEKIDQSLRLLQDVAVITTTKTPVALQVTKEGEPGYLSSNAAVRRNPLKNCIDESMTTFFRSASDEENTLTEPHCLQVFLGKASSAKAGSIQFDMLARVSDAGKVYNHAQCVYVYGSNDGNAWIRVGIANAIGNDLNSSVMRASNTYRYWRLDVMSTEGDDEDTADYPSFNVADFKFYTVSETVAKVSGYGSRLKVEMLEDLLQVTGDTEGYSLSDFRTPLGDLAAYEALVNAYNTVYDIAVLKNPNVGIGDINAEGNSSDAIYDLSGRKVNSAAERGIYIQNGKKVLR